MTDRLLDIVLIGGVGVATWYIAYWLGRPLQEIYDVRRRACVLIYRDANVGMANTTPQDKIQRASEDMRALAADLYGIRSGSPRPMIWFAVRVLRFDLLKAERNATGFSNSYGSAHATRLPHQFGLETSLRLPITTPREEVEEEMRIHRQGLKQ